MARIDWQMEDIVMPGDMNQLGQEINANKNSIDIHINNKSNPHEVTTEQINRLENNAFTESDKLTDYPVGYTFFYVNSGTTVWPILGSDTNRAIVETKKTSDPQIGTQRITVYSNASASTVVAIYERVMNSLNEATSWGAWHEIATSSDTEQINNLINNHINNKNNPNNVTPAQIGAETPAGAQQKANTAEANAKAASVPIGRTVNGKALSANISLNYNDVGAANAISTGSTADPNTTQEPYILTNHANSPGQGLYWHIHTYFYSSRTGNRAQQAISYSGAETKMFIRHYYSTEGWRPWTELGGGSMPVLVASNTLQHSFDTERVSTNVNTGLLVGKFVPEGTGEVRISADLRASSSNCFLRVQRLSGNYVTTIEESTVLTWATPVGANLTTGYPTGVGGLSHNTSTYANKTGVIYVTAGVPVYIIMSRYSYSDGNTLYCRNVRVYYDVIK